MTSRRNFPDVYSHIYGVTKDGFGLVIGYTEHLYTQLVTTSKCNAIANSHCAVHHSTHLNLLSLLCLHQSVSGNGFQRRTFPFLWVTEMSPSLSYRLLTTTAHKD
jgi:hypothetical protein